MPNWNLKDDWPYSAYFGQNGEFFVMPINNSLDVADLTLGIDEDPELLGDLVGYGPKILIIDIQSSNEIPVYAITPGVVLDIYPGEDSVTLSTTIFTTSGLYGLFGTSFDDLYHQFPDIRWFKNWLDANTSPTNIIYENINTTLADGSTVRAGEIIGTALDHPYDHSMKRVKIRIEYDDSTDSNPKFMHPKEFFSLLFWRQTCDPIFNDIPEEYEHPLLRKMMESTVIGDYGSYEDYNEWLGLRPPLRTYKRLEWEARVEKVRHADNWLITGNLEDVFQNPLIREKVTCPDKTLRSGICHGGPYYLCCSKCNLFAGEMAFRAGFKVFVRPSGGNMLAYRSGNVLVPRCDNPGHDYRIFDNPECEIIFRGETYRITPRTKHCGKRRYVTDGNKEDVNIETAVDGKVFVHTRKRYCLSGTNPFPPCSAGSNPTSFHIVFLSEIRSVSNTGITASIIDQHLGEHGGVPWNCSAPYCGCQGQGARAFIELMPGGDPTERWGVLDLNCLEEVT